MSFDSVFSFTFFTTNSFPNWSNSTTACFDAQTVSTSLITLAIVGFSILLALPSFISIYGKNASKRRNDVLKHEDLYEKLAMLADPYVRLFSSLSDDKTITAFFVFALLYLVSILISLVTYLFDSLDMLLVNLIFAIIITCFMLVFIVGLFLRAGITIISHKDFEAYTSAFQWFKNEDKSKEENEADQT